MSHIRLSTRVEKRTLYATATVDRCVKDHRVLHLIAENEDVFRSSSFEIDDRTRQYPIRWIGLPPGFYFISAIVMDGDGRVGGATRIHASIPP